ncbi:MAG: ribosome recycling factor [Oscillospiraceae bacterium]|jgi:ribosome recycling factor|nr:ribosome recycling factor [Oscillospiraceae bacterium]
MREELKIYEEKMKKSIANLEGEYASIRAGKPNPAVLDKIKADYYGTPTAINQMAAISVDAHTLVIQPWDKNGLKVIEKAISASDLGITPNNDGNAIRLSFPQLTEERRKDLAKQIKKMAEESKIAIRNIRRDAESKFKAMKKSSEITEDDLKDFEKDTQKLTDKYVENIDKVAAAKEKEIMTV